MLTSEEEVRVAGGAFSAKEASRPLEGTCDVAPPPSTNERQQIVRFLKGLLVEKPPVPGDAVMQGVLVGEEAAGETEVSRRMWRELEESWDMHRAQATVELGEGSESGLERVMQFPATMVANARGVLEQWLLESVSTIPTAVGWGALGCRMRRACNLVPNVTARDLARAACRPELLRTFNPFLSDAAVARLHEGVLEWLQLCVLEDKLGRMEHLARAGFKQDLEKELQELERPEWVRVRDFPHWLVFEVEQQLQIRGNQYTVARHLMENKGAITQLNMGEGKTRVILPMLALHLSSPSSPLLRVHFLSQLLAEAAEYLHACLTASLLNRRIFLLPFHRDVSLDLRRVRLMRQGLERCRAAAGFVCVAPEHRLSLDLKFHELTTHGAPAAVLQLLEELAEVPFFDILDESDELLRHKYPKP
ncbi:hypothetical protein T484DRAFT_1830922 [Baffinella frigidus]|nr:hypothetical protein T484DRAFT_1830922 [Cryptophyta sp. CCMP2293]